MKKVLFGYSQSAEKTIEKGILEKYKATYGRDFTFDSEYCTADILQALEKNTYDILILKEDLEKNNKITIDYLDFITDKYHGLHIVFIINNEHQGGVYVKRLFSLGIYSVIFKEDLRLDNIVELMEKPLHKCDAKIYMDIDNLEVEENQENMQEIPDERYQIILNNFKKATVGTISDMFDEVDKAYTEKQMLFLLTRLPKSIKDKLEESKNESYSTYNKRLLILGEQYREKEESSSEVQQVVKTETKVVTKIEKEYIQSIPTDYNKIVGFTGKKTGTSTIVDMVAKYLSQKGKRVTVIDLTKNKKLYYMKCWGNKELTEEQKKGIENLNQGKCHPIHIEDNYTLYTQIEGENSEIDFYNALEQIRYDNDVILIDMDYSIREEWLKYGVNALYLVQDLDVIDKFETKEYLRSIREKGVNTKKIHLVINKYVNCKVKAEDILTMLAEPIPYMEYDNTDNYIQLNPQVFKIDFDIENYKKLITSHIYMFDSTSLSENIQKQISEICNHIYPIKDKNKKGLLAPLKNIFKKKK